MRSINRHYFEQFLGRMGLIVVITITLAVVGCASMPQVFKMEPRSIAKRLGLPNCRVSVPLSQSEVIDAVKRWDNYPNPEKNQEWIEITSNLVPGDQLRMVSCKVGDPYFYAMIRNDTILFKFHPVIIN
ncbi:hypothetical protein [Rhodanobacter ginsengiterrae]|uniref:hypothetical protein n=1 Tax=Rhodanobacter ginsengiterrae TaxID=2008451 RepID=UPI003CEF6A98